MNRRSFLTMVGFTAAGVWLPGCALLDRSAEQEYMMDLGTLQHTWTDVNGVRVHSLVSPVRLCRRLRPFSSTGPAFSGRYTVPTAVELTRDFSVYVPDLPGFGDSDKPDKIFTVPELADWVAAWMPAIGLERASLLGNSFGCQVIADLAARYPDRVERAILQGPTTPPDERSWFWQFIRWRQNQRYNSDSLGDVTNSDYKKAGFRRIFCSFQEQLTDRIEDKAPRIQAPVLVVRGEHDPIADQEWCETS